MNEDFFERFESETVYRPEAVEEFHDRGYWAILSPGDYLDLHADQRPDQLAVPVTHTAAVGAGEASSSLHTPWVMSENPPNPRSTTLFLDWLIHPDNAELEATRQGILNIYSTHSPDPELLDAYDPTKTSERHPLGRKYWRRITSSNGWMQLTVR